MKSSPRCCCPGTISLSFRRVMAELRAAIGAVRWRPIAAFRIGAGFDNRARLSAVRRLFEPVRTPAFYNAWRKSGTPALHRRSPEPLTRERATLPILTAPWPPNISFRCRVCRRPIPAARRCSKTSGCRSIRTPRSASSGVNGSGKSTLLKIMAGIDKEFNGEARAAEGTKMGYLEQEPVLDPSFRRLGQRHRLVRREANLRRLQRRRRQTGRGLFRRTDGGDDRPPGKARRPRSLGHRLRRSKWPWTRCAARPTTPR